jgi:thiol:disulfide interchange protein DsbG
MTRITRALVLALPFALAACGQSTSTATKAGDPQSCSIPAVQEPNIAAASKCAHGFDTGNLSSARQVYVFFDPQCPHCGAFWRETKSLEKDARFTWVPVSVLNRASLKQASAILSSTDPVQTMSEHEAKLLAGTGGLSAPDADPKLKAVIEANTKLLESFGATGVPFVMSLNNQTGKVYSNSGGMPSTKLAEVLGWKAVATPAAVAAPVSK